MTDEVNNPVHYNQNGIEVIDVIETYAKHDFRLANVLKYVCRAGYKGHPLQDLQKAQWYLNRVVSEMEVVEALTDESWLDREESVDDAKSNAWLRGYNEGYEDGEADHGDPAKYNGPEPVDFELDGYYTFVFGEDAAIEERDELYQSFKGYPLKPGDKGYTSEPVDVWRNEENRSGYQSGTMYEVHCPPDRIAGDGAVARDIKDTYYDFNRFEIKGYCANCDKELAILQPHVTDYAFYPDLKFCSAACVEQLKVWQGR